MDSILNLEKLTSSDVAEHGLPGSVFRSESVYQDECQSVFEEGWVSIAIAQQVAAPGDVLPVSIAGQSLLITRDRDSKIHVFRNVCRHKCAMLVDEPCSKRATIVCPYHRWTYRLDGPLLAAPFYHGSKNPPLDDEAKEDLGLIPVSFNVWWDIIFVNLSGSGQKFDDFVRPLDELLSEHDGRDISLISATDYECDANWKLIVDNFLDGYHVGFVHSQASSIDATLEQENLILSEDIVGLRLANGAAAKPAKTAKALPTFPGLPEAKQATQQWFALFPNTLLFVDPCWVQTIIVKPQGVSLCTETLSIYVTNPEAASDELETERDLLHGVLNEVNTQDIELLSSIQKTRSSDLGDSGNLVRWWDDVGSALQTTWLKKIKAYRVTQATD